MHPLESKGYAADGLDGAVPDATELAFSLLEAVRVRSADGVAVQMDVTTRSELRERPEVFVPAQGRVTGRLGMWLTPLVVEADGTVVLKAAPTGSPESVNALAGAAPAAGDEGLPSAVRGRWWARFVGGGRSRLRAVVVVGTVLALAVGAAVWLDHQQDRERFKC